MLTLAPAAASAARKAVRLSRNGCAQSATEALVGKRAIQARPLGSGAGLGLGCADMALSLALGGPAYARIGAIGGFKEGMRASAGQPARNRAIGSPREPAARL